jgi:hypothetical protein
MEYLMGQAEVFAEAHRMKATDAMRAKAKLLEREAADWRSLADSLDAIEKHAASQSVDGNESPVPHIGVGSAAELLLWRLVTHYKD